MSQKRIALIGAFFLVCSVFACSSCTATEGTPLSGTATLVVASANEGGEKKEYAVDLSSYTSQSTLCDLIDDLAGQGVLYYEGYYDVYGKYYTAIGYQTAYTYEYEGKTYTGYTVNTLVREDALQGEYLYLYTSVVGEQDASSFRRTVEYGGRTLVSAAFGASGLHFQDGAVLYITLVHWE